MHGKVYLAGWTRPDKVKVWAVWTAESVQKISLRITGKAQALNYLGEAKSVPAGEYAASPELLYLVGPEQVEVH